MLSWYTLYTKPRQEGAVAGRLEALGLEVFCPRFVERRRGMPPQVRPLFPCYLFARLDLAAGDLAALRWTPGLRYVVSFAGVPARVPEEALALVRRRLEQVEATSGRPRAPFRPGETVRIVSGPLAGLEAIFEGPLGPAERVRVLLRFLGQANRAEVPVEALAAIEPRVRGTRRTRGRGRYVGGKSAARGPSPS